MNREEKEIFVTTLHEKLTDSRLAVLVDYTGLNVTKMTSLRQNLRKAGMEMKVIKNTLLRRAADQTAFQGFEEYLVGPKAIIFSHGDPSVSTKVLMEIEKQSPELRVHVGTVEGQKLLRPQLEELASLPGREVLLARILQCMNTPITHFVLVLNGVMRQFLMVLEAIRQSKEQKAGS